MIFSSKHQPAYTRKVTQESMTVPGTDIIIPKGTIVIIGPTWGGNQKTVTFPSFPKLEMHLSLDPKGRPKREKWTIAP